ncbi:MAG: hypothetical protein ACK4XJ_03635 [Fimbriimonadaceae bacterium]
MNLQTALKEQFHASLAMLAECVEKCPDDLWISGEYPRYFWRIALHSAFFTNAYLYQDEASYRPWPARTEGIYEQMWADPAKVEPYELPDGVPVMGQSEVLRYILYVDSLVDDAIDGMDLDTIDSGLSWYEDMSKLSNVLMALRHNEGHVGQLSELLMMRNIDVTWVHRSNGRSAG